MKKVIATLALALLAAPLWAQNKTANFGYFTNIPSAGQPTLLYSVLLGQSGSPFGADMTAPNGCTLKTVGASVTISEFTASCGPFLGIAVGDLLVIEGAIPSSGPSLRVVRSVVSNASVTVEQTIDLSGFTLGATFKYRHLVQASTGGWISSPGLVAKNVHLLISQVSAQQVGGLDFRIECSGTGIGSLPVVIWPGASSTASCGSGTNASGYCNYGAAAYDIYTIPRDISCSKIRLGMQVHTSQGAQAVEADQWRITTFVELTDNGSRQ